ncbi:MAG: rubredoxin [Calditrichaceae bacterium]
MDPPPPLGDGECTGSCYICTTCEYIYDSANGDPENGIIQGTVFSDLPDDWNCPICGASKDSFYEY